MCVCVFVCMSVSVCMCVYVSMSLCVRLFICPRACLCGCLRERGFVLVFHAEDPCAAFAAAVGRSCMRSSTKSPPLKQSPSICKAARSSQTSRCVMRESHTLLPFCSCVVVLSRCIGVTVCCPLAVDCTTLSHFFLPPSPPPSHKETTCLTSTTSFA